MLQSSMNMNTNNPSSIYIVLNGNGIRNYSISAKLNKVAFDTSTEE